MNIFEGLVKPPSPGKTYSRNHHLDALKEEVQAFLEKVNRSIEQDNYRIPIYWSKGILGGSHAHNRWGKPEDPWWQWGRNGCVFRTIFVALWKAGWDSDLFLEGDSYVLCLSPRGNRKLKKGWICPECGSCLLHGRQDPEKGECWCNEEFRRKELFF